MSRTINDFATRCHHFKLIILVITIVRKILNFFLSNYKARTNFLTQILKHLRNGLCNTDFITSLKAFSAPILYKFSNIIYDIFVTMLSTLIL